MCTLCRHRPADCDITFLKKRKLAKLLSICIIKVFNIWHRLCLKRLTHRPHGKRCKKSYIYYFVTVINRVCLSFAYVICVKCFYYVGSPFSIYFSYSGENVVKHVDKDMSVGDASTFRNVDHEINNTHSNDAIHSYGSNIGTLDMENLPHLPHSPQDSHYE